MAIFHRLASGGQGAYSCSAMWRIVAVGLVGVLTTTISGQSKPDWQARREACITALSSFAIDPIGTKPPELPDDLEGVTIEYVSSGHRRCPAFTLHLEKNKAGWDGHAFVHKKGKAAKQISDRQFCGLSTRMAGCEDVRYAQRLLPANLPEGTSTIITDVQETSITLSAPGYSKKVLECFTTIDGKPETPNLLSNTSYSLVS